MATARSTGHPDGTARAPDLAALVRVAVALGAGQVAGLSEAERAVAGAALAGAASGSCAGRPAVAGPAAGALAGPAGHAAGPGAGACLDDLREQIAAGGDPLGDALSAARGPAERRDLGQTLTPPAIVASMTGWAAAQAGGGPRRVVDPGTGSGRFLLAAGRRWPDAALVGVETDPVAALVARANLAAAGLTGRATVIAADYRTAALPAADGPTLFIGNPPYVRHHRIPAEHKRWLASTARARGLAVSALAGLHAHFFLATAQRAAPGDLGVFITAAEWLDVNYGILVRSLLLGELGGQSLHLLDPASRVFADATVTSVITCFRPGSRPRAIRLRVAGSPAALGDLGGGRPVPVAELAAAGRWGPLARGAGPVRAGGRPAGHVELGEICRVHRGQVTGANAVWVRRPEQADVPARFRFPAVTRARELFDAGVALTSAASLRVVVDLPAELGELSGPEREVVAAFLARAARSGAAGSYIARHRRAWWRVGLAGPAPIIASYMARRPPAFVRNLAGARHLNIAHGLYPAEPLPPAVLDRLAAYLRRSVLVGQGRTYAGGLTKFEPREMERLLVPWDEIRSSC